MAQCDEDSVLEQLAEDHIARTSEAPSDTALKMAADAGVIARSVQSPEEEEEETTTDEVKPKRVTKDVQDQIRQAAAEVASAISSKKTAPIPTLIRKQFSQYTNEILDGKDL